MINLKDLFLIHHANDKFIRDSAEKHSFLFYDKRVKEAFASLLGKITNIEKFYFTQSSVKRAANMDLSNIFCDDLSYLYDSCKNKNGFIFCDKDKIHFTYTISSNHIILCCYKGSKIKAHTNMRVNTLSEADKMLQDSINSKFIGSVIFPFSAKEYISFPNDSISRILASASDSCLMSNLAMFPEFIRDCKRYTKLQEGSDKGSQHCIKELEHLISISNENRKYLHLCVQMFIFLKTIKVIDKTLILEENSNILNKKHLTKNKYDYIKVDSFFNENINVINPFSVKGHFRNQPKKNSKGEWYKELIYIDGFIKKGYKREATKTKINI